MVFLLLRKVLLKPHILFALTVGILLSSLAIPLSSASSDNVTVTSTNVADKTTLQFTNNPSSTSNVVSFIVEIKDGSFLSFKLDNGWIGKKTQPSTIAFISSTPLTPGDSATFVIRTNQQSPDLVWIAYDANNNKLGTGEIGAVATPTSTTSTPTTQPSTTSPTTPPTQNSGILDMSTFRIIPSTPSPGFDIRVVGQSFAASTNLDLYIGDQKIDSFSSDSRGNFVVTTTIPLTQQPGNAVLVLKDQAGNKKTFTAAIQPIPLSRSGSQGIIIPLTINMDSVYHRGEIQTINGTANSGSTVAFSLQGSKGDSITSFTAKVNNKGSYSVSNIIPIDRPFGNYTVVASVGKEQVSKEYELATIHVISISTSQQQYNAGDTVLINGTAIPNAQVSIVIIDPSHSQVFAKDISVASDGRIHASFPLSASAIVGTYVITATLGSDQISYYFGVGVQPVPILTAVLDKLNYQVTDKPIISISGPPSSTMNLVIVDPSDKEKFSNTILLGPDGLATYSFNLTSYTPGIYSAVITRGNDKVVKDFAIGLQIGSGQINIKTIKDIYFPGDNIIILGNSNPNTIIQITLSDPHGTPLKSIQTFTDKNGIFSAFDFRIPDDGAVGDWKLDATSGINHRSVDINVKSIKQMTIQLDKTPASYSRGDIVQITGSGAGVSLGVTINVLSQSNTVLETFNISSTNRGDYSTGWNIPKDFSPGTYTIQVKTSAGTVSTTITIQ